MSFIWCLTWEISKPPPGVSFYTPLHPFPVCVYAKLLQSCATLCNPMDCSPPQAPLSMGFPSQEHWSGLLFPPPEIELTSLMSPKTAFKYSKNHLLASCVCAYSVTSVVSNSLRPTDCSPPGPSVHGTLQQEY